MDQGNETVFSAPEYDELLEHVEKAKQEVEAKAKSAVGALFKAFFAAHPNVGALKWTQYTPHFNDGEACEFRVNNDFDVLLGKYVSDDDDSDDESNEFVESYGVDDGPTKEAIRSLERAVNEDVFLSAFGDHAKVVATPEGFHVTEYSHD